MGTGAVREVSFKSKGCDVFSVNSYTNWKRCIFAVPTGTEVCTGAVREVSLKSRAVIFSLLTLETTNCNVSLLS